jgi:hypothetical protein
VIMRPDNGGERICTAMLNQQVSENGMTMGEAIVAAERGDVLTQEELDHFGALQRQEPQDNDDAPPKKSRGERNRSESQESAKKRRRVV